MSNIGKKIYGFCNGYFGREDYATKIIIYETEKAICCAYLDNEYIACANFDSEEEKNKRVKEWGDIE